MEKQAEIIDKALTEQRNKIEKFASEECYQGIDEMVISFSDLIAYLNK